MVHVKDFGKGAGFEFQAVCHQRALEIAHSALPFVHAAAQRMDSLGRKAIDAARNVAVALVDVVEARDIKCAVRTHVSGFSSST